MKIEMAEHPQVILDTMDQIEQEVRRSEQMNKLKSYGAYALIGAGVLGGITGFFQDLMFLIVGGIVFVFLGFIIQGMLKGSASPLNRFDAARQILRTLRDDTGRKGRVVGWLDLSNPRQDQKKVRSVYRKTYYRDPWFRVKIKLADGNLLHLSLEDRIKVKSGKRGFVNHVTQVAAKLVVNPDLYRTIPISGGKLSLPNATLADEDGIFTLTAKGFHPNQLPIDGMLQSLKVLYSSLEPIGPSPELGG